MIYLVLVFLALASAAQAGPWPRPPGEQFLSFSVETPIAENAVSQSFVSAFYERGLRHDWTIGIDAGADALGYEKSFVFLRRPVWSGERSKLAFEIGLGRQTTKTGTGPALRPALTWGRSFEAFDRSGWMQLDASIAHLPTLQSSVLKLETTVGLTVSTKVTAMLQATFEAEKTGQAVAKVTPSVAYKIHDNLHVLGGAIFSDDTRAKLKFGVWTKF